VTPKLADLLPRPIVQAQAVEDNQATFSILKAEGQIRLDEVQPEGNVSFEVRRRRLHSACGTSSSHAASSAPPRS
jgi:hypothetical protein